MNNEEVKGSGSEKALSTGAFLLAIGSLIN
jgi:hypothetical protein